MWDKEVGIVLTFFNFFVNVAYKLLNKRLDLFASYINILPYIY